MRVTGGRLRGRILETPRGRGIRPTSDRVREAVFNILGHDLSGLTVMDLFAGTGSLGIEALSRGACHAVFVDNGRQAIRLVEKNLARCELVDRASVLKWDLRRGIPPLPEEVSGATGIVFLDPPYGKGLIPVTLDRLSKHRGIGKGARVVAEGPRTEEPPPSRGELQIAGTRLYGDTRITLYRFEE